MRAYAFAGTLTHALYPAPHALGKAGRLLLLYMYLHVKVCVLACSSIVSCPTGFWKDWRVTLMLNVFVLRVNKLPMLQLL